MADLAVLQARLTEAETALHELNIGKRIATVARDGRRIDYTSAPQSVAQLRAYIADLQTQIAALTGVASDDWRLNRRAHGPMFR